MKVWPDKNAGDVKQADLTIRLVDGVSESQSANELFSYMSRYVQAHENLNQQNTAVKQIYKKSLCKGWALIRVSHKIKVQ